MLIPMSCIVVGLFIAFVDAQPMPNYALEYAPLLYLSINETCWPSTLTNFLSNVAPWTNYTPIADPPSTLTANNLNDSSINGEWVYLSNSDITDTPLPAWLTSNEGKPDASGLSISPSTIILVNKTGVANQNPPGDLDVFYFAFYGFNLGPFVQLIQENFGNHAGDIEWTMIRYLDGSPQAMFFSEHEDGAAWTYNAVQKNGSRPISYIAVGDHANYPTTGKQYYSDTADQIYDETDAGFLWDPVLNWQAYWYTQDPETWTPVSNNPSESQAVGWLEFQGYFGNKALNESNPNQQTVLGQQKWGDGPLGPRSKTLVRTSMCYANCSVQTSLPMPSLVGTIASDAGEVAGAIESDLGISPWLDSHLDELRP